MGETSQLRSEVSLSRDHPQVPLSSAYGTCKTVRPDSGLGFQGKVMRTFRVVPFTLGSGVGLFLDSLGNLTSALWAFHTASSPGHSLPYLFLDWCTCSQLQFELALAIHPPRCRANMAHIRQPRPDSGIGFQVKVLKPFSVVPSSLGRGHTSAPRLARTGVPRP